MKIEYLTEADRDSVVDVLCAAFRDYPFMRYVLKDLSEEAYDEQLSAMIGFFTDARFMRGNPVLGIREGGGLVAVELTNTPDAIEWPAELHAVFAELEATLGADAWARLEAFERATNTFAPVAPHHFVGMVGTLPGHHGRGYGTALLREVEAMARAHPKSIGVTLTTETAKNVAYYRHLGYEVIGEADVEEVHTTYMLLRALEDPK
jgi:GNAT superfamily N-acetyltransferase